MKKYIRLFLFILTIIVTTGIHAQVNVRDSVISTPIMYGVYGFHFLSGDIADMYGNSSTIGAGLGYKLDNNIYFGLEYSYLFGGKVKNGDEILQDILTEDGQLIGQGGEYAIFQFMQRGHIIWAQVGKIFPVFSPNPNSGILIKIEQALRSTAWTSVCRKTQRHR